MRRSTIVIGGSVAAALAISLVVSRSGTEADPIRLAADPSPPAPSASQVQETSAPEVKVLKLGERHRLETTDGYDVEVAALKHRAGADFEGVQVRTCNRGPDISVSRGPWALGYEGFESLHVIDVAGGGLPAPAYEDRDLLRSGECAKGWINFTRVDGARPDGVQYSPQDAAPVRWEW